MLPGQMSDYVFAHSLALNLIGLKLSRMPTRLHTIGYEKRTIDEYLCLLLDAEIDVLVDVRETAWSHKPGFSKSAFEGALNAVGIRYVHARFAGNPKSLRQMAASHSDCLVMYREYLAEFPEIVATFDALVGDLGIKNRNIAITCFERHPEDCHRSILADAWREYGRARRVEHLHGDGCKRIVST